MNTLTARSPISIPRQKIKCDEPNFELSDQMHSLCLIPHKDAHSEILKGIHAITQRFHGLRDYEIETILQKIERTFSLPYSQRYVRISQSKQLPRTIYFDCKEKIAYVFLKTKGKLPVADGGFKRGTHVLRILWEGWKVEKAFQLVSHDRKENSAITNQKPLYVRLYNEFEKNGAYGDLIKELLPCHAHFIYDKTKKETNDHIYKVCSIFPYCTTTLTHTHDASPEEKLSYLRDIAYGLKLLHEAGIVHGDIKFENILIHQEKAKLADFDFAFFNCEKEQPLWAAKSYGTREYSAPELLLETTKRKYLPKVDIYALGIIACQIGYEQSPPWCEHIRNWRTTGNSQYLDEAISSQQSMIQLAAIAREDLPTSTTASECIGNLSGLMLHPTPKKRLSAHEVFEKIEYFNEYQPQPQYQQ